MRRDNEKKVLQMSPSIFGLIKMHECNAIEDEDPVAIAQRDASKAFFKHAHGRLSLKKKNKS